MKNLSLKQRANRGSSESGVTLIEMLIACTVLAIGLVSLVQLFIWATMNNSYVVASAGGLNDAQRLIEYYKGVAATSVNGVDDAIITSRSWDSGTEQNATFVTLPLYDSAHSDYKEYVWVYKGAGTLVGTADTTYPSGVTAAEVTAPSKWTRVVYVRMVPKTPDPRVNRTVDLKAVIGTPAKPPVP